jgi:hypothetical protein
MTLTECTHLATTSNRDAEDAHPHDRFIYERMISSLTAGLVTVPRQSPNGSLPHYCVDWPSTVSICLFTGNDASAGVWWALIGVPPPAVRR